MESITQLKDAIQAAEKLFGWNNKPATQINNNVLNVVCSEDQRKELIQQRERLLARGKTPPKEPQTAVDTCEALGGTQASPRTPKASDVSPATLLEPLGPCDNELPMQEHEATY